MSTERKRNRSGYYPLFLNIKGKPCLVVGGGEVAWRKVITLLDCEASVTVVSPVICSKLMKLAESKKIRTILKNFGPEDVANCCLVITATNQSAINRKVASAARKNNILVNVVDDPELSDFILPAILSRGDLTLAVSTGGKSPALSRKLRDYLEECLGKEYGALVELAAEVRKEIKSKKIKINHKAWQDALDLEVLLKLLRNGERVKARSLLMGNLIGKAGK